MAALIAALDAIDLLAVLVGGVLATAGTLLVGRMRDRRSAGAAARLVYGELRDNARQLHALQGVLKSQYALLYDHLTHEARREISAAGFEAIDDVEHYLAHLDDFALAAAEAEREDLLDEVHEGFWERLREKGILPSETLRRSAWRGHAPALVGALDAPAIAAMNGAYELIDRVRVTAELADPVVLAADLYEFFVEDVRPGILRAMELLLEPAGLKPRAFEADVQMLDAAAWEAMQDLAPLRAE